MTTRENIGHHPVEDQLLELVDSEELGTLASEARSWAKVFLSDGYERHELIASYKSVVGRLYDDGLDDQAEELLEVLAELEGFCSPQARL